MSKDRLGHDIELDKIHRYRSETTYGSAVSLHLTWEAQIRDAPETSKDRLGCAIELDEIHRYRPETTY
jgi:hypothetical protein